MTPLHPATFDLRRTTPDSVHAPRSQSPGQALHHDRAMGTHGFGLIGLFERQDAASHREEQIGVFRVEAGRPFAPVRGGIFSVSAHGPITAFLILVRAVESEK